MDVVVVESPAKAKTINQYLGADFIVLPSYGHVRDLPAKDGSVRPDEGFAMTYRTDPKAEKHLGAIAKALKGAEHLYLATDPDREGEAISWHVLNALEEARAVKDVSVKRVVFNEITRNAVLEAIGHPRDLDMNLINAQQARRALDYLVGFTLSPVLWRKLPGARSAGRVQSVALRLICDRELEIEAFDPREYWTVEVTFATAEGATFKARLTTLDGDKLGKFSLASEASATAAKALIEANAFAVAGIETKPTRRHPPPPFTTSTLQQEASRKLGFGAKRTMQVAQRLYEGVSLGGETGGLITYMRTDGVQIAGEAIASCRQVIAEDFGNDFVPDVPRAYRAKAKNAQEAHEAIRPTDLRRRPDRIRGALERDEARLYELIWKRAIASQMENARLEQTALDVASPDGKVGLRATGTVTLFPGFLKLYEEGRDDAKEGENGGERRLPRVREGEALERGETETVQHFTEPPPRFTEATLVKRLEELGIGRPSTYASILSVLQDRDYVRLEKKRFMPEDRGRLVTAFLTSFFHRYVEYDFTADLEDKLDRVSAGEIDWKAVLSEFWEAFNRAVGDTEGLRITDVLEALNEILGPHIFYNDDPDVDPRRCPACSEGRLSLKVGRYGAFVGCANYPDCRYTRPLTNGNGDGGAVDEGPRDLGQDPESGLDVSVRKGPYGFYVQLAAPDDNSKPKRVSLPDDLTADEIALDVALRLLALPRQVGLHPESGKPIVAGIGRYGAYLKHQSKYARVPKDESVLTVGLNRAVTLLAEVKGRRGAEPLRVLGDHPDDGRPIEVMDGRYGPYVKHNRINATIPKGASVEELTIDEAIELLRARAAKAKTKKGTKAKAKTKGKTGAAKKSTARAKEKRKPAADPASSGQG
jgi:DNA topoisomerase-1